jgi:hypothetical protein
MNYRVGISHLETGRDEIGSAAPIDGSSLHMPIQ